MAIFRHQPTVLFLLSLFMFASSQPYLGVTYSTLGANMPAVADVGKFLDSTYIQKVRLFNMNTSVIKILAAANIDMVVGTDDNNLVQALVQDPNLANDWVKKLMPWADKIDIFVFGNQVMGGSNDTFILRNLVTAMGLLQNALKAANLKIKVSTVNSLDVIRRLDTPSSACFKSEYYATMEKLLKFLRENKSPYMTTIYPYDAFQSNPTPDTLAYCLFQKNAGRIDPGTGLKYWNMFDAQVDAVRNAIDGFQFPDVEIVVAETGWPTSCDDTEVGGTVNNARMYIANLIHHLRSKSGTPMMPKRLVRAYIHSLLDGNYKQGRGSNQAFGLLNYDFTWKYNSSDLSKYVYNKP